MQKEHHAQTKHKRPRGRKQYSRSVKALVITAMTLMCVLSFVLVGGGVWSWIVFSKPVYGGETSDVYVDSLPPDSDDDMTDAISDYGIIDDGASNVADIPVRENTKSVRNILLIGIDSPTASGAGAFSGRSDTTMILTINSKEKTIKLTSILRDTLVTIPGRDKNGDGKDDYAKFNAAWAYGGFDLMSKTIEQNFRLKIDQYIAVNFYAFSECIDAMGGIDMDLTGAEAKIVGCGSSDGMYHLDGQHALSYARIRHLDSDFGRTNRQRKVIAELFTKAKTMNVGQMNDVLMKVLPEIKTNMTTDEFMGFIANSITYFSYQMGDTYYLPQQGEYAGKAVSGLGDVLILNDKAQAVTELHQFIYN